MYYPEELVEEVRARNDIVDVISGYVTLKKKGSNYWGCCPFHNEKTPSFSVSSNKQMYYCFGCHASGNVYTFLMKYENDTFPEAVKILADRAGVKLPEVEETPEQKKKAGKRMRLLEVNKEAARYFYYMLRSPHGEVGMRYLTERKLTDETMHHFGLGYAGKNGEQVVQYLRKKGFTDEEIKDSGLAMFSEQRGLRSQFWNRVMFPIQDINHRVIGFGGRVMGDGEPKYLNSPETMIFDKRRNLYGLNFARTARTGNIILCEGYMDVIALHQAGFDNAVASLGTSLTSGHASLLKRYTKEVYLTFDSDGAGIKAALRAIPILKEVGLTAKVINMKPYKDPDEFIKALGAEEYQKRIDAAENSFMFEIRILEQKYDMKDPEGKTAFQTEVAKKLLDFTTELERNNYMEAVADKYHMSFEALRNLVNQLGTQGGLVKERTPLKSGLNEKKHKKEDGMKQSQKLLLTWLIEYDNLYDKIKDIITPEDFTEDIFRKVAELLYEQKKSGTVNPAQIISLFAEEEEQREVAELFHARIHEVDSAAERDKALKETILRVKDNSISYRSAHLEPTDMQGLQQLVADKRTLQNMEKMHISID